jgi:CRP/FNR family transcriptional regulator
MMDGVTKEKFLSVFPVFKNNSDGLAGDILSCSIYKEFSESTTFYSEGDACTGIGLILSGEVRVYKVGEGGREITLYEIVPGETCILNVSCILSRGHYPANAVAVTEGEVLFIPEKEFRLLFSEHESLRNFIFSLFSQRFVEIMELIEEVAFGKMDKRLSEYLIEKSENSILNNTHQQIANDLGTSREVISRLLKDLEKRNKVVLARHKIHLKSL